MAVSIEVIRPESSSSTTPGTTRVIEVVRGGSSPIQTVAAQSTVEVVRTGGTVANVQWGYGFPSDPYEGQLWLNVTE